VKAAIGAIESGATAPGHIGAIVDALRPAYDAAKTQSGDLLDNMVRAQTTLTVARLGSDPLLEEFIDRGELAIRGAYYSLDTGAVSLTA
jgi:carbonic anhydrase